MPSAGTLAKWEYCEACIPLALVIVLRKKLPSWVVKAYLSAVAICACGWEIWMTFGLAGGASASVRRSDDLNRLVPVSINWLLASMADGGYCLFALLLVWLAFRRSVEQFGQWDWRAFLILCLWLVGQNVYAQVRPCFFVSTMSGI
jgi:hypothetical protein